MDIIVQRIDILIEKAMMNSHGNFFFTIVKVKIKSFIVTNENLNDTYCLEILSSSNVDKWLTIIDIIDKERFITIDLTVILNLFCFGD